MVYRILDYWVFALCPSYDILKNSNEQNSSKRGSVSVLRWRGGRHLLCWVRWKQVSSSITIHPWRCPLDLAQFHISSTRTFPRSFLTNIFSPKSKGWKRTAISCYVLLRDFLPLIRFSMYSLSRTYSHQPPSHVFPDRKGRWLVLGTSMAYLAAELA
jgi:hypothetical protein